MNSFFKNHRSQMSHHQIILILIFLNLACYLAYRFGIVWYKVAELSGPNHFGDFGVYWLAAERLAQGAPIYLPTDSSPFKYSPTFAYIFRYSFFLLEKKASAIIWILASIGVYSGATFQLASRLLATYKNKNQILFIIIIGIFLSWRGLFESLSYLQIDLLLGAAIVWITTSAIPTLGAHPKCPIFLRTLIWSLVLSVKPQMGIILLPAIFAFGIHEGLGIALATLFTYWAPSLWIGTESLFSLLHQWITCLRIQQDSAFMTSGLNQTAAAVIARLLHQTHAVGLLEIFCLTGYLLTVGWLAFPTIHRGIHYEKSQKIRLLWLAFGMSGYLVFCPLSWRWLTFLWVPIVAIIAALQTKPSRFTLAWLVLATLTKNGVANLFGLTAADGASQIGLYMWASTALFLEISFLIKRSRL